MEKKKVDIVIEAFRNYIKLKEDGMVSGAPTNSTNPPGQINIAGLPPDNPPVDLRKGRRRNWNPFFKNLAQIQRRNNQKTK